MTLVERFLKYVSFDTQSSEETEITPSTPGQMVFARYLKEELESLGLEEITLDENGYLFATLPANTDKPLPVIGFIAHMDTSPDMSGKNVSPHIVQNYDGKDIVLCAEENVVLSPAQFPELLDHQGEDLIVTDGKTLLGADDKVGIAEIVSAVVYLKEHPEIKHGKIRIGFNPDEEIGLGAHKFNVEQFGCEWAYTMDGGEVGELEFENFNAAFAKISFKGRNVHPGYAKNKMINSIRVANRFMSMLPADEAPEHTEGYEGFYHLIGITGEVEQTTVSYIIRDHDRTRFEERKKEMERLVAKINEEYGPGTATLELRDQYYNMREQIEPVMHIIDTAFAAMKAVGVEPRVKAIRGGTDGAQLSFKGLPCPNIFAGGLNFHGRYEFVPIQNMEKAMNVIVKIAELVASKFITHNSNSSMKTTPFTEKHVSLGAKMHEFAGYNMPIEYSGIIDEHLTVCGGVGVFDVSHMGEFWVKGPHALDFLQKVTSNNVAALTPGKVQYTCFPNEDGGIVDDLLVYHYEPEKYLLVVNASNIEKDWNWCVSHNTEGAELENASDRMAQLAVQGPKAILALQKLTSINLSDLPYYTFTHGEFAGEKDVIISNTGYTGAGGFELYFYPEAAMKIWDAVFEAGAEFGIKPVGLGARDTLRLEMGFCLYGNDLDDTTSPIEAGLGWITKFVEGKNFTNRPMLEKQKAEGTTRKLVGFEMIDRGIPRHGYELYSTDGTAIGVVTSGTMSPTRKIGIGMGYIRPEYSKVGTEICIDMRGRKLKAVVVKPPFRKQ